MQITVRSRSATVKPEAEELEQLFVRKEKTGGMAEAAITKKPSPGKKPPRRFSEPRSAAHFVLRLLPRCLLSPVPPAGWRSDCLTLVTAAPTPA